MGAQQLDFINIGIKLKLPAQECYNIMQDKKGYIWFSTEAGLCRYNGKKLKVFDKTNGLPEGSCYTVNEDENGVLWITTSTNRILKYDNDSLYEASFSKIYQNNFIKTLDQTYYLKNTGRYLYLNTQGSSYQIDLLINTIKQVNQSDSVAICSFVRQNKIVFPVKINITRNHNIKKRKKRNIVFNIEEGEKKIKIPIEGTENISPDWRILATNNTKNENFISINNFILKLNPDLSYSVQKIPGNIIAMYCDKENGLWVGTIKNGVHYFENSDLSNNYKTYLSDYSVSGICEDHEKGIWCTTLEKGVFYCRNKYLKSYANIAGLDKKPDLLKVLNNKIFTSTSNNEIIILDKGVIKSYRLKLERPYYLNDIAISKDGNEYTISGREIAVRTNNQMEQMMRINLIGTNMGIGAKRLSYLNGRLFGINFSSLLEIKKNGAILRKVFEDPGNCITSTKSQLFVGLKTGLFEVDTSDFSLKKIKGINGNVSKIIETTDNELWITTKDNGLYIVNNKEADNFAKKLKTPTDRLFDIVEDKNKTIWVGSNIGLLKISKKAHNYALTTYNTLNGFPSNEIYDVVSDQSSVYFSTTEGISAFSLDHELSNDKIPDIYLKRIEINEKNINPKNEITLSYSENSLKFEFDILTFKEQGNGLLFYKLNGPESKEQSASENTIELNNLTPGKYTLTVFAVNNEIKGKKQMIISFEIKKPFWQKEWFIVFVTLSVCTILYFSVRKIILQIKEREEKKTQINKLMAEYQLTALQAQMNPHFIFNAINSIQTYILEHKAQVAYDYLAKFSRLIRMVLNYAKEKNLTLENEIEMLKIYVELEQMRFENKFDFELNISDNIDTYQTKLPPMLLQPYIENAIWHGLIPLKKTRKGKLKVSFTLNENILHIIIEDNGIGRNASKQIKKTPGHRSVGMELTRERITILRNIPEYKHANIQIIDVYTKTGEVNGTRIEIILSN